MMRIWRLSVCRVYIVPKSRTERPRKTKIGTEVAHVTRDSDTSFRVKRSKVNLQGRRHIVAASRTACLGMLSLPVRTFLSCSPLLTKWLLTYSRICENCRSQLTERGFPNSDIIQCTNFDDYTASHSECHARWTTQLPLTRRATPTCNMQWHGLSCTIISRPPRGVSRWAPNIRPFPYVLPRQIWSFYVERCKHKERKPKIGELWPSASWDGAWLTQETCPSHVCCFFERGCTAL